MLPLNTVEPRYNEVLGTTENCPCYIQVSALYQGKKTKKYKEQGLQQILPCYKRVFAYIRPLYNEVPLYINS